MERNINGITAQMETINASFRNLKIITIVSLSLAFACAACCVVYTFWKISQYNDRIYVVDNGSAFSAHGESMAVVREDEVRDQVIRFHELFFNMPPDQEMVRKNVNKALDFTDDTVYKYFNDLEESGFIKRLESTGSYQVLDVEQVDIDMSRMPYSVITKCMQYVIRKSSVTRNLLVTSCQLYEMPRSQKNVHGLQIRNFEVLENSPAGSRVQ